MVDLDINFTHETITGMTSIWLGFDNPVKSGFEFNLHSRQCTITEVRVCFDMFVEELFLISFLSFPLYFLYSKGKSQ